MDLHLAVPPLDFLLISIGTVGKRAMDAAIKDEIANAVKAAERDQLVQGATRLLGILQKHGFVVKQQIVPDQVGTHPAN